jgi:hypothetical protein
LRAAILLECVGRFGFLNVRYVPAPAQLEQEVAAVILLLLLMLLLLQLMVLFRSLLLPLSLLEILFEEELAAAFEAEAEVEKGH